MDTPVDLSTVRPWRSAAIVAGGIAALELLLLVFAAVAIFAKPFAGEVEKAAAETVAKATSPAKTGKTQGAPAPELLRRETSVLVLNGNGRTGAAGEAAAVIQALNYSIAGAGDASRTDFARSVVMYRPGFKGEAARLAREVRVKRVAPLDGMKAAELQGAHIALIVGRAS